MAFERLPEMTVEPVFPRWPELLRQNRELPSNALKAAAREDLCALAESSQRALNAAAKELPSEMQKTLRFEHPALRPAAPVVMSGHQPIVYHPGILFKTALLSELADSEQAAAFNIGIDSDEVDAGRFVLPCAEKNTLRLKTFSLASGSLPVSSQTVKSREELAELSQIASQCLTAQGLHEEAERARQTFSVLQHMAGMPMAQANSLLRWLREERRRYFEVPFSALCQTDSAKRFMLQELKSWRQLFSAYNDSLNAWREQRRIENPANPFPNLMTKNGSFELPFWMFDQHKNTRVRLLLREGENGSVEAHAENEMFFRIEQDTKELPEVPDKVLLPRGGLISTMLRLLYSDLFIHGLGGARYDAFTDSFIEGHFALQPPVFVTASKSRYLFSEEITRHEEMLRWKAQFKDAANHTGRYLGKGHFPPAPEESLRALENRRKELVAEFSLTSDKERVSELGKALRNLNAEIKSVLSATPIFEQANGWAPAEATLEAWYCREYPFFLFGS